MQDNVDRYCRLKKCCLYYVLFDACCSFLRHSVLQEMMVCVHHAAHAFSFSDMQCKKPAYVSALLSLT